MPIRRGAKGTDLGGQFVGPKSIARALIKMMTPHEAKSHDAAVKARAPQSPPAIGRLMAGPSRATARMTPATRAAIAADHKASFGHSPGPRGDMLAAARAHVAKMAKPGPAKKSAAAVPAEYQGRDAEVYTALAGKSPAELKALAYDANIDIPANVRTKDARIRYLIQTSSSHDGRSQGNSQRRLIDLAQGESSAPSPAAAKMARAKAAQPSVTPDMLRNAQSADDIAPLLENRTAADLRQIAADAGIHVGSKATKQQVRDAILQHAPAPANVRPHSTRRRHPSPPPRGR